MNDDLDAIQRVLADDVESFRRLMDRYQRPILTLVRNLTPRDTDHEGVTQEVFLAAFRYLVSFAPNRSAFSTCLFTIARNRCRNELARRRPVAGVELPESVDLRSPELEASEAEVFRQFDAAPDAPPAVDLADANILSIQLAHGDNSRDLVNSIAVKPFVAIRSSIL